MSFTLKVRRKRLIIGLGITTIIGIALCLAFQFNLLYSMQKQSSDFLFRSVSTYQATGQQDRIVIVSIDDKSLEQLGQFSPWPRSHYAQLVDTLAAAEARVIVFDILFSEPSSHDEELAASMRNAGNVVLPMIYMPTTNGSAVIHESAQPRNFIGPSQIFTEEAAALGHANVVPDFDGVVRRLCLAIPTNNEQEPALALSAVAKYLRRPEVIESTFHDNKLPFAGRSIPVNDNREMLINYIGGPQVTGVTGNFQAVSFVDVLNNEVEPTLFQDKIVIIGATAVGLGDTFMTPMGRIMNGVEIHANAIHTILSGNFLSSVPPSATTALILVLALLTGLAVLRFRMLWATFAAIFLCIAYFLTASSLFDYGVMLNMLYPPLAIGGTFTGMNLYNITSERSEKKRITKTFGRYISPSVADEILTALEEGELKLKGEEHDVTVAFADIRGFTSISESMSPEELVSALNVYLSAVIKAVHNHNGTINKFGGDSITAIWNVPTECEGHALLAVEAALEAQRAISELQTEETLQRMDFGIGINTGRAVAGNMGSEDRLEYSVIGDTVNIAARLASTAPGGKVWVGANTFERVADNITANPLFPLEVKGKREPIRVYEIVDIHK